MSVHFANPAVQRLGEVDHQFIKYDRVIEALDAISLFHGLASSAKHSKIMLLYGESGSGKSQIAGHYVTRLSDAETGDAAGNAIYVEVPAKCTQRALASAILNVLEDPCADRGNASEMIRRIANIVKRRGINFIVLDEFQHFIDRESKRVIYNAADSFKDLALHVNCGFLLVGMPSLCDVISNNSQLERRVVFRRELSAHSCSTKASTEQFQMLLVLLAEHMPFGNSEIIATKEFASAICSASKGLVGLVVRLLHTVGLCAILRNKTELTVDLFAEAYAQLQTSEERLKGRVNPFSVSKN